MKSLRLFLTLALVGAGSAAAAAEPLTVGDLSIEGPYALATAATAMSGAGYLTITNTGETADRLIAVEADFPRSEIHTTVVDDAGVARMMQLDGLDIPPGETVVLAPRGNHLMFMGLSEPFEVGDTVAATLVFEKAGRIDVALRVQPRDGAPAMEMHGDGMEGDTHGAEHGTGG